MLKRTLALVLTALSLCGAASAKVPSAQEQKFCCRKGESQ